MSVAAQERLHRSRTNWTPNFLLRLRQEAEEEEQDVSGVQDAYPVGHLHLPRLRRRVHACRTTASDRTPHRLHRRYGNLKISFSFICTFAQEGGKGLFVPCFWLSRLKTNNVWVCGGNAESSHVYLILDYFEWLINSLIWRQQMFVGHMNLWRQVKICCCLILLRLLISDYIY